MGISSPVLGLRPGRCGFSRSWKLPKPDSLTLSFDSSAMRTSSKKRSTMSLASRLLSPSCSKSKSASSALVSVIGVPRKTLAAQHAAESILYFPQQYRHDRVDFGVRQSTCSILYKHQNCKAFFPDLNTASAVDVKERDVVHRRWLDGDERVEHSLGGNGLVNDDGEVAAHDG